MKILMYTGAFLPRIGGAELVVHNLAEGLAQINADIYVATFYRSKEKIICKYKLNRMSPLKGIGRFKKLYNRLYKRYKLKKLIKVIQPDIIHVHYLYPTGFEIVRLKEEMGLKVPIVITSHGIDIQKNEKINYGLRLDPKKEKKILYTINKVDKLIAISDSIFNEYKKLGVQDYKIVKIPNPIAYDILSKPSSISKSDFGIEEKIPVILTVGRNHPKKGFKILLDIVRLLKLKNYNVMCIFVGRGVTDLSEYASQLGILDSVMFFEEALPVGVKYKGKTFEITDCIENFFRVADVFVMTSFVEAFGLVVIEAMAAGKPVIAMRADGINDLIQNNYNGILVERNNEKFAQKLIELLSDSEKRKELSKNSRRYAAKFSRESIALAHLNLYKEIIKNYH